MVGGIYGYSAGYSSFVYNNIPVDRIAKLSSNENSSEVKALKRSGEVMSTSVSLKTATCPECGRSYVSGGNTTTQIKYNLDNPYEQKQKDYESYSLAGQFVDYVA